MQIGNADMDAIYEDMIAPAMRECDIAPIRVDKHNDGRLLQSQIARFIRDADIIVADLTNERPNCYAEVGLAMGWEKFGHVILAARSDHKPDRPGRAAGEPKVHFDLGGYDFLYWDPADRSAYRVELVRRIRHRLAQLPASTGKPPRFPWPDEWLARHRNAAHAWRQSNGGRQTYMEIAFGPEHPLDLTQQKLRDSAEAAQVHTFGWPLGVVLAGDARPVPSTDGIVAKIAADIGADYWTLSKEGCGYVMNTNFEEHRWGDGVISIDTRIVRVTEAFLYVRNLMKQYGVADDEKISAAIWHGGLKGRTLRFSSQNRLGPIQMHRSEVDDSGQVVEAPLKAIDDNLVAYVKAIVAPMLALFDYFQFNDGLYKEIVEAYVGGQVI